MFSIYGISGPIFSGTLEEMNRVRALAKAQAARAIAREDDHPGVAAGDDVARAWRCLQHYRIHQTPVLDDGTHLVGIISERDLLTVINIDAGKIIESLSRRVREIMTTPVVTATPVTDIRRIASAMLDDGVDGVPIMSDGGRLVGFVSRGDILCAVVTDPPLSLWR